MKKLIGLILIQAILLGSVFGQFTFKKQLKPNSSQWFYDITVLSCKQTLNNGYVFIGELQRWDNWNDPTYGLIFKMDAFGNIEWQKQITDPIEPDGIYFNSLDCTDDGGYVVTFTGSKTGIVKFNSSGDIDWSKYVNNAAAEFNNIKQDYNGDYILSSLIGAMKIDNSGNFIWAKNSNSWQDFNTIIVSLDSTYILAGRSIVEIDNNGNTIWSKSYVPPTSTYGIQINSIQQINNTEFVVCGDNQLLNINNLGNINWSKTYGASELLFSYPTLDGGYIIGSSPGKINVQSVNGFSETEIIKLNSFGDTLWIRQYGNSIYGSNLADLICTSDGGYLIAEVEFDSQNFVYSEINKVNDEGYFCFLPVSDTSLSVGISSLNVNVGDSLINDTVQLLNFVLSSTNFDIDIFSYDHIPQNICLISVDSTSTKNKVVWEKPITQAIDSFMIYREFGTGNYGIVGSVHYDSLSQFYDNTVGVNPNITSYRYKISAIDTCGNESQLSDFHETMHLSTNLAPNGNVNLIWDAYEGFPVIYYRILRDSTFSNNWEVMDSVSSNVFIWTDINPPTNGADYVIDVIAPFGCTSTKAQDHNSTRSNRANILGGGVSPGANFTANFTQINIGGTLDFLDQSINNPTSWTWQFPGGSPAFSTQQNPSGIAYSTVGLYDVTLIVSNANGLDTLVKTNYIEVLAGSGGSAPACDFLASATQVPEGAPVDFLDLTLNSPTSWTWLFPGGNPAFQQINHQ